MCSADFLGSIISSSFRVNTHLLARMDNENRYGLYRPRPYDEY